jgi:putative FmdB family regulatory protein
VPDAGQIPEANVPTYQYTCTACGHRLEAVQSFSDAALTACPECEGRLRKVFSSVGVVFKGSGFYRTDSRAGSSAGENGKEPAAAGAGKPDAAAASSSSSAASSSESSAGAASSSGSTAKSESSAKAAASTS